MKNRNAACGNLIPGITSIYWWEGEVQEDEEVLAVFKTSKDKVESFVQELLINHPYDCPEAIILPIVGGNETYIEWVAKETSNLSLVEG